MRKHPFPKKIVTVTLALCLWIFASANLQARPVSVLTIKRIADEADVVVVGEVTAITSDKAKEADNLRWHTQLLEMKATIRVFRSYEKTNVASLASGSEISLTYLGIDPKHPDVMIDDGPVFPRLAVGNIFAFPLVKAPPPSGQTWALLQEEAFGLLIPCVAQAPPASGSLAEKLWSELAQTFSCGSYGGIYKAACYLQHSFQTGRDPEFDKFLQMLDERVGQDDRRWLQIGVAAYCSLGYPRPDIADLPSKKPNQQTILAAHAFQHVTSRDLSGKTIEESLAHIDIHSWATASLIFQNYRDHPLAIKLITEALERGDPHAIAVAYAIVRKKRHPLVLPAIQASVKFLGTAWWQSKDLSANYDPLRSACLLIAQFGGKQDFAFLLDQIRKAQKSDMDRYRQLWGVCDENYERLPEVCRVVIDDKRTIYKDDRFCDRAVWALERRTKLNFGSKYGRNLDGSLMQSESERDKAVEKAKSWLNRNYPLW